MVNKLIILFVIIFTMSQAFAQDAAELTRELQKLCFTQTQNDEAFNKLKEYAVSGLQVCMESEADFVKVMKDANEFQTIGNATLILNTYCLNAPAANKCVGNLVEMMKVCLNDKLKILLSIGYSIFINYQDYMCTEGRKFSEFIDEYGHTCVIRNALPILECLETSIKDYKFTGFGMTTTECNLIENVKNCVVKPITTTECAKPVELIENFYKSANDQSLCASKLV